MFSLNATMLFMCMGACKSMEYPMLIKELRKGQKLSCIVNLDRFDFLTQLIFNQ